MTLTMKRLIGLLAFAVATAFPGDASAQANVPGEPKPVEPKVLRSILPVGRGAIHMVTTDATGGLPTLVVEEVGLKPGISRQLWSGSGSVIPWFGRSSVLARRDGSHRIAIELHGGGTRCVRLLECAPRTVEAGEEKQPRSRFLQDVVFIENAGDKAAAKGKSYDLTSPTLFEFRGEVYMVGSAMWDAKGEPHVFLAKFADLVEGKLDVLAVGRGIDPRVTVYEQEIVIAMRVPDNAQEIMGQARVSLVRSVDARNWKMDELSVEASPRGVHSFELGVAGGDLVIASLAHKGTTLEFWKIDSTTNTWGVYARRELPEGTDRRLPNLFVLHGGVNLDASPKILLRMRADQVPQKL